MLGMRGLGLDWTAFFFFAFTFECVLQEQHVPNLKHTRPVALSLMSF